MFLSLRGSQITLPSPQLSGNSFQKKGNFTKENCKVQSLWPPLRWLRCSVLPFTAHPPPPTRPTPRGGSKPTMCLTKGRADLHLPGKWRLLIPG